ncbi:TPA: hypothetical protein HA241_00340 [Candidatus Woesearchaeota archaeon]|nr:hypothetical protein [Candidatus Woesearchaeota archaeon]
MTQLKQDHIRISHIQDKLLQEGDLIVRITDQSVDLPSFLSREEVDLRWTATVEKNPRMTNQPRYFLDAATGNMLRFRGGSYADFLATNEMKREAGDFTPEQREEALRTTFSIVGVGIVYLTKEGVIVLQNRSGNVTQGAGTYSVPSGGYSNKFGPDAFAAANAQLSDEQGLTTQLGYVGISADHAFAENPTLIFVGNGDLTVDAVYDRYRGAQDKRETNFLRFISSSHEGLLKAMRGEFVDLRTEQPFSDAQMMGTGYGALMLFGNTEYGSDWLKEAIAQVKRNPGIAQVTIDNIVQ